MSQGPAKMLSTTQLRSRAEARVSKDRAEEPRDLPPMADDEVLRTIHELQVHQVELMMQNEELMKVRAELEVARAHYFDLYHLAPIGYCILSREGVILEANLTAVNMLGLALSTLVRKPITGFIFKDDRDIFYLHCKQLYATNEPSTCELRMVKQDGTLFWAQLSSTLPSQAQANDHKPDCRVVMSDITERRNLKDEIAMLQSQLRQSKSRPKKA